MPVPGAFPFPAAADGADEHEDEDLLMPGPAGAWGEAVTSYGTPASGTPRPVFAAPPDGSPDPAAGHPGVPGAAAPHAGQAQPPQPVPPVGAAAPAAQGVPQHAAAAPHTPPQGSPVPGPAPGPEALGPEAVAGTQTHPGLHGQSHSQPHSQPHDQAHNPMQGQAGSRSQEPAVQPRPAAHPNAAHAASQPAGRHAHPAPAAPAHPMPAGQHAIPPAGVLPAQPGAWQTAGPAPGPQGPEPVPAAVPPAEAGEPGPPLPAEAVPPAGEPAPAPAAAEPVPEAPAAGAEAGPDAPAGVPAPRTEAAPDAVPESAGPAAQAARPAEPVPAGPPDPDATAPPAEEAAPGYAEAEREAVHRLMRERRDVRNGFRPDPIPHEVLLRVLEAAHTAPSVGHSQPWDFVIIRSEETRQKVHELAMRQRAAYAESLPRARAKQFKELKVEAILDTPVNIVVTADPTRGGRHTLGRHSQPQMAPYSAALAVENLWLAARAEGLGVGWVSFFDERELVRSLELPGHLEIVAYLCIGYVDEFPGEPELVQTGWSRRRPLSWVVHEESYGRRALPGADPHDLLAETLEQIRPLDAQALGEAWERQKRMTKPAGSLGALEIIGAQLCGLSRLCPPPVPEPAAVAVFAGDHGVHAQGVTPWPQEVTAQMVANFLGGGAVCNAFANQVGAEVCVIDVGVAGGLPATPGLLPRKVRPGTADFTAGPAMTPEEAQRAVEIGIETARDLVAAGNRALLTGEMGIANTTVSAALIAACTGADPAEVTGRGTGINDETHALKIEVVRRALELHKPDPAADPLGLLAAIGGLEHAALTGFILGGASLRVPVILDGVSAGAAALVARTIAPEAVSACVAGHRSAEPGHAAALNTLGLRPLVDLDLRLGEGTGALLALPLVQSAARAMAEVATFDAAGITDKN
ncbi:nicotinate-nucleotide--dimethylbenzimidazole phosphoribosyltransferase [Streptomyces aidingensis]|nr:nicotinate-nucleotide--dimethylbenzimidazole phosphoribosyltransferase [Streptomyces aidingensis]